MHNDRTQLKVAEPIALVSVQPGDVYYLLVQYNWYNQPAIARDYTVKLYSKIDNLKIQDINN